MADQIEQDGCLEITNISGDWNYRTSKPDNWPDIPRLASIQFNPGATDDILLVRQGRSWGPERFYAKCENDYDQRIKYFHGSRVVPFIQFSECAFSAGHKVIIELWRE